MFSRFSSPSSAHGCVSMRWPRDIRFHPDEALYSTFARAAALNGDWWLSGSLDKPPLALYFNALAQVFVGDSEFATRLPGTLASILLLPVMYVLTKSLYRKAPVGSHGGVPLPFIVLTLTALSPFAIAFSATALTDGPMLLSMALSLLLLARNRWGWSGLWLGLGFASKPAALYYLPLLVMLGWGLDKLSFKRCSRLLIGLVGMIALVVAWDTLRPGTSLFTLASSIITPDRFIRANEIIPRLQSWLHHGQFLLGPGWFTGVVAIIALSVLVRRVVTQPPRRDTIIDLLLLSFLFVFGLMHWLVALNTFDHYLLPALPLVIVLASRGIDRLIVTVASPRYAPIVAIALGLFLLPSALMAATSERGVNTAHRNYTGIDDLAAFLNQQPVATVIYDHWLGWELGYYLGQWHDKRLTYYPAPDLLVADALALCEIGPRYFPVPRAQPVGPWLEALAAAGFEVEVAYENEAFMAYRLTPPEVDVSDAGAGASPCAVESRRPAHPLPSPPGNAHASHSENHAASPVPPA